MKKADHDLLVGRTIAGKYVVEALIGSGAMGAVFRARQVALEKTVAIKVMHGENADDPAFAMRFQREAKAASRLNHPNSIQVLDFGAEPDGLLYIAMEYLDGRSLHHLLRDEWPLAPARIADLLMQTLAALAVAHDMGVVHRDLKPENVMVLSGTDDDGQPKDIVKVCDFGIAKISDPRAYRGTAERESDAPVTTAGFLVGTPEYMSPEQGRGEKLDPRSDLYSVGVILYEMLTKRVPFDAENAIGIVLKHITEEPLAPSRVVSGVDPRLEAIALRALKKFREERQPNARDMRAELRVVAEGPAGPSVARVAPVAPAAHEPVPREGSPAIGNAATVEMPMPALAMGSYAGPKPTLHGTTASVAGPAGLGRGWVLAGVVLVALMAGASGTALLFRKPAGRLVPARVAAQQVPLTVPLAPAVPVAGTSKLVEAMGDEPMDGKSTVAPHVAPAVVHDPPSHAKAPAGSTSAKGAAPLAATAGASASPPANALAVSPPASATASPASGPASASASAPASEPALASASAPGTPPEDGFDPEKAYVEVGMINAEGVRERAVRGALHGLALAQCYRSALRAHGARATGVATLNLSFDEGGLARSAVLTGADFLPGIARCVQETASGVHIAKAQVDLGGGVAEVTLGFSEP